MNRVFMLICLMSFLVCSFTLDTTSNEDTVQIPRPDGFAPFYELDESDYYDTITVFVPAVIVDTLKVDFDLYMVNSNRHVSAEIREKEEEIGVILRTLLLAAEREGFTVRPYEKKLFQSINEILKKGNVKKLSLIPKDIY